MVKQATERSVSQATVDAITKLVDDQIAQKNKNESEAKQGYETLNA